MHTLGVSMYHHGIAKTHCNAASFVPAQEQQSQELSASERQELLQLARLVWPEDSSDPAVRAKAFMAAMLVILPHLTLPRGVISLLGNTVGRAKALGVSRWRSVFANDACFVLGKRPSGDLTIRLDARMLRQKQGVTGSSSSSGGDSSSGGSDGGSSSDIGSDGKGMQSVSQVSMPQLTMCVPMQHLLVCHHQHASSCLAGYTFIDACPLLWNSKKCIVP